ncbi:MAG: hypothetical protein LBH44_04685 [Treponema sp.]|nr:hypothetical protein [Treponema sp.]
MNDSEFSLLNLVPTVLRARGFRLYTQGVAAKGEPRRLIDLWQNGGAAVLGHNPPNLLRELKNAASRGLYAPFPHFLRDRYFKALSRLFPGRSFRIYASPPAGLDTLFSTGAAGFWRPFLDPNSPFAIADNAPPVLVPILPGIQGWRNCLPLGLCILAAESENQLTQFPASDILPPVLFAAAARGIYDLVASPDRAKPVFPRIAKVLQESRWQSRGIYLSLKVKPETEAWAKLFRKFLDVGFLLPPVPTQPLILPGVLSAGEEAKLAETLAGNE